MNKTKVIWTVFLVLLTVISTIIGFITERFQEFPWSGLMAGTGFFACVGLITIYTGWREVPNMHEWVIEFLGTYVVTWKPGLHFLFPGLMKVRSSVGIMEDRIMFFMDDSRREQPYGRGSVDFQDGSAPVEAVVFFKVVDATKAVYGVHNVIEAVAEVMDAVINGYLVNFQVEEANELRSQMTLARMLNRQLPTHRDPSTGRYDKNCFEAETPYTTTEAWSHMYNDWGVEVTAVRIQDIVMGPAIEGAREKVLIAEREAEAAKHKRATAIELSQGLADGIRQLVNKGLQPQEAAHLLETQIQWTSVKDGNFTKVLVTGSDASQGARLGAGMKAGE